MKKLFFVTIITSLRGSVIVWLNIWHGRREGAGGKPARAEALGTRRQKATLEALFAALRPTACAADFNRRPTRGKARARPDKN